MATTDHTKYRPTRRTRIVCISDTHNCTVKLPAGDVLIHAGDITNQGSYSEVSHDQALSSHSIANKNQLSRSVKWLEGLPYESKIVIAGNHDITLDAAFLAKYGHEFHNKKLESHERCLELVKNSHSLTYLQHEMVTIKLSSPNGPRTTFTVFGSPRAPAFGHWAFYYPSDDDEYVPSEKDTAMGASKDAAWEDIPAAADVVVTHTPPRGHCDDRAGLYRPRGCEHLRRALWRVRPRLAVCGHIHDGRGASRISWDLQSEYGERDDGAAPWQDPGAGTGNRVSLLDLTGKKSGQPLKNDGRWFDGDGLRDAAGTVLVDESHGGASPAGSRNGNVAPGWHGRKETCVVNAAVLKSNFPHVGGKQFNKPIVVDLELPVAENGE